MEVTMLSSTNVVDKTPKSIPIKLKTMQCAIVGFLKKIEGDGLVDKDLCEKMILKLPLLLTVEEQLQYYNHESYDLKYIEQLYIKPRILEHKKASKQKSKVDKSSKPKKAKAERAPKVNGRPNTPVLIENDDDVAIVTPIRTESVVVIPETPVKKSRKRSVEDSKPRGRKTKETEVVFSRDEDDDKISTDLSTDLVAEKYVEEKPKKKRVMKKKPDTAVVAEEAQVVVVKEQEIVQEDEKWLIMREGVKYWAADENEVSGPVYENIINGEGDSAPGKQIGILDAGILIKNN
jgi:hypothetical protein